MDWFADTRCTADKMAAMASTASGGQLLHCGDLSLWAKSRYPEMAVDHTGQCPGRGSVVGSFTVVLLLRRTFRQLRQDLWFSGRSDRLHDMALDLYNRRTRWSEAQRGDRTPDCTR